MRSARLSICTPKLSRSLDVSVKAALYSLVRKVHTYTLPLGRILKRSLMHLPVNYIARAFHCTSCTEILVLPEVSTSFLHANARFQKCKYCWYGIESERFLTSGCKLSVHSATCRKHELQNSTKMAGNGSSSSCLHSSGDCPWISLDSSKVVSSPLTVAIALRPPIFLVLSLTVRADALLDGIRGERIFRHVIGCLIVSTTNIHVQWNLDLRTP